MNKIGILTFQNALNYGAVLQAYALRTYIESCTENQIEIINYKNQEIENTQSLFRSFRRNPTLKELVRALLLLPYMIRRKKVFYQFCKGYLLLSDDVAASALSNLEYDKIIVGSDQVWNLELTGEDTNYFCDFDTKNTSCYSYAASIGKSTFTECDLNRYRELLMPFSKISFREKELIHIFKTLFPEKDILSCIDPVFLISREHWIAMEKPIKRRPYLLFFCVGNNPELEATINFAWELAHERGLEPLFLSDLDIWYKHRNWHHCGVVLPNQFIGYINHAECIVTNSFHATAFSILLHKSFYSETGLLRSGRILNLLEMTHLDDRAIVKGKRVPEKREIDWKQVDREIDEEKRKSYAYLSEIMSER